MRDFYPEDLDVRDRIFSAWTDASTLHGFQRFEPTAVFEMDSVNTAKTRGYFEQVWADLDAAGIPFTLHWGK